VEPVLVDNDVEASRAGAGVEVATSVGGIEVAAVRLYRYAMMAFEVRPSFK
jgi:hypothetical protein